MADKERESPGAEEGSGLSFTVASVATCGLGWMLFRFAARNLIDIEEPDMVRPFSGMFVASLVLPAALIWWSAFTRDVGVAVGFLAAVALSSGLFLSYIDSLSMGDLDDAPGPHPVFLAPMLAAAYCSVHALLAGCTAALDRNR